jgi:hypothetical protein
MPGLRQPEWSLGRRLIAKAAVDTDRRFDVQDPNCK